MSRNNNLVCDVCGREIRRNYEHYIFPLRFYLVVPSQYVYIREKDGKKPRDMCLKCFEDFKKFVKEKREEAQNE